MTSKIVLIHTELMMNLILMIHFRDFDGNHIKIYMRDDRSDSDDDDRDVYNVDDADEDGTNQERRKHSRNGGGHVQSGATSQAKKGNYLT